MEEKEKTKTVWNDISKIWKRVAGVMAAVTAISTLLIKALDISPELTYCSFAALGIILLIVSFYVDKQTEYTHQEIIKHEEMARQEFTKALIETKEIALESKRDAERRVNSFKEDVKELISVTQETRKDTLRIQLLMILEQQPENIDTILKLAETYFIDLHGDWYMTSLFNRWAKQHDIEIPSQIYSAIKETHKKEK